MSKENKVTTLVNLGQMKLMENAYNDAASPAMKKIGMALSTVLDIGNTVLWPVKWANERTRIYFENNLNKYKNSLENIPEANICEVPSEIAIPILERFKYLTNEDLSNAFVKLLLTASSTETISLAHPGFIYIIDRLSPDEAKILTYYKAKVEIPFISVGWYSEDFISHIPLVDKETQISKHIELNFKNNIDLYFDNLISLGLISQNDTYYINNEHIYEDLLDNYKDIIANNKPAYVTNENRSTLLKINKGMYLITHLGKLFIQTCIDDLK